jgi:predicted homoserine dehydrogenase-like protein
MPKLRSTWPPLEDESRAARHDLLELASALVGSRHSATGDQYPEDLERLASKALESPDEARRLLEAAATLLALAVGRIALDNEADFVREFDEVDFVIEMTTFERSVRDVLAAIDRAD